MPHQGRAVAKGDRHGDALKVDDPCEGTDVLLPVVAALLIKGCGVVLGVGDLGASDELTHHVPHAVLGNLRGAHNLAVVL